MTCLVTTTHMDFYDVPFMSLKMVFSLCFTICDICVTKIGSSPIPCNKRCYVTSALTINLMTIILSSLICDTQFRHNQYKKMSQNIFLDDCTCATENRKRPKYFTLYDVAMTKI